LDSDREAVPAGSRNPSVAKALFGARILDP
jgi:hypothetical protein